MSPSRSVAVVAVLLLATGCGSGTKSAPVTAGPSATRTSPTSTARTSTAPTHTAPASTAASTPAPGVPTFAHIVVVVLENHAYSDIIGQADAPAINAIAASGAVLTASYAVAHPSEPNYLALFSGSTQGLTDDSCPHTYTTPDLGSALRAGGKTFVGYSEDLPAVGYPGCNSGGYVRRHNPWVNFGALPAAVNQPLTAFPRDYTRLPTVAFVIPNLSNDMHDGSVAQGDEWLRTHLGGYAAWAPAHGSLLIITTDEDDHSEGNRITTILTGAHVRPGRYPQRTDHFGVLRTILDACGVAPFARAAAAAPITAVWSG